MSERTHRHELEKNVLADWIVEKYELLRPYGTQLAIGALVLVAAAVGAIYYFSRSDSVAPRAWQTYFAAFGEQKVADALKEAYEQPELQGTSAELWARLSYADQRFQVASMQGGQDSFEAKTALADAEKALTEVMDKATDPILIARARFTLARVYESQNKPNKARELYQQVVDAGKETALGKKSAESIKRLDPQGETVQVLAWLAEQKPLARPTGGTNPFLDGFGGGMNSPFGPQPTLPERPNLNLPGADSPFGSGASDIDFGRDNPLGTTAPELNAPEKGEPATKSGESEKGEADNAAEPAKPADAKPAESPEN